MTKKELERRLDSETENLLKAKLEIVRLEGVLRRIKNLDINDFPEGTDINEAYVRLFARAVSIACVTLNEWD